MLHDDLHGVCESPFESVIKCPYTASYLEHKQKI